MRKLLLPLLLAVGLLAGCPPREARDATCKSGCKCWPSKVQQSRCIIGCQVNGGRYTCPNDK